MEQIQGIPRGAGRRVALVAARSNDVIVSHLIEGAVDCFLRHDGGEKNLVLVRVPGSLEIPLVAGRLADGGEYDAVVCLDALIRTDMPHFDYIAAEASKGMVAESVRTGRPIIFGILTCNTQEEALERVEIKSGNTGWDAMLATLEVTDLMSRLHAMQMTDLMRLG